MNSVNLIGRLTADPQITTVQTEKGSIKKATYSLAVDRRGQGADFPRIVAFNKAAEFAESYFKKGQRVGVTGRLNTSNDTNDGIKYFVTDVIVESQYFADGRREGGTDSEQFSSNAPDGNEEFMNVDMNDEGLPFR